MTTPPTVFNAVATSAVFGCSSIADAAGNLLFYTNGSEIRNSQFLQMLNGGGLVGGSGIQSVLIVKQPGTNPYYYVFTADLSGLRYSVVDMSLASGLGAVATKNVGITSPAQSERIAGTRHCNGKDVWILSQDLNTNNWRAYLLTASGISSAPVVSATAFLHNSIATLKFSPNGKKIASGNQAPNGLYLYDFNTTTGTVSNGIQITPSGNYAIGVDFSADGSKLYACFGTPKVVQWDLCAGNAAAIDASAYTIGNTGPPKGSVQLGPDGKIYLARNSSALGVVNNPNLSGAACNYAEAGLSVAPHNSGYRLPNFVKNPSPPPAFSYTVNQTSCSTASFTASWLQSITNGCSTGTASITWNFGDPGSGSSNVSALSSPVHVYPGPGTYSVQLIQAYECGTDTIKQLVTILNAIPTLSVSGNFTLCEGLSTTLTASGAAGYTWTTSGVPQAGATIILSPIATGVSIHTVTGVAPNGCEGTLTTTLHVLAKPVLSILGNTLICAGGTTTLSVTGASTYTWSNGSHSPTVSLNTMSNNYLVIGTGANGCVNSATIQTSIQQLPTVTVNNATTCIGNPVTLIASGSAAAGVTYSWSPGGYTGNNLAVNPNVTTVYSVTASINGCVSRTSNTVTVTGLLQPVTGFSYSTAICQNQPALVPVLAANFNTGGNFSSSGSVMINAASGEIDPSGSVAGTYQVNYSLNQVGCTAAGLYTSEAVILPAPVLKLNALVKVAPGASAMLSVSGGLNYNWSPSSDLSCSDCANPVVTPVQNKVYCVSSAEGSCESKACVFVEITCDTGFDFSLPNAFTPNGDGNNDEFCLQGWNTCVKSFQVMVFDRWGEKVFESHDANFCWDGIYKGRVLEKDVFLYLLRATYLNNSVISRKGNISLIR